MGKNNTFFLNTWLSDFEGWARSFTREMQRKGVPHKKIIAIIDKSRKKHDYIVLQNPQTVQNV